MTVSLDEDQNHLLQAYLAAFNHDDVAAIIQLARADVLNPIHALSEVVIRANHHVDKMRWSGLGESTTTSLAA